MTGFVRDYGLIIVFLTVALETSGVPLPGETAIIAAAILASQGHYAIGWVIVVASVAAIVGDNVGYWLGRWLGRSFLQSYGVVRRFSNRVLPPAERFFERHGGKAIFLARWFSGFRIAGAWLAGFAHMPWWRFFLWNAAGGIAWALSVSLIAYYSGRAAADAIAHYGLVAAIAIGVIVIAAAVGVHLWRRRVVEES
jgi:membrane protein DedA with SNARE-associated domain